jgi:hypothetical protein
MTDHRTPYLEALNRTLPAGMWYISAVPGRILSDAADMAIIFKMSAITFEAGSACVCVSSNPDTLALDVRRVRREEAVALRKQAAELQRDADRLAAIAGTPPA